MSRIKYGCYYINCDNELTDEEVAKKQFLCTDCLKRMRREYNLSDTHCIIKSCNRYLTIDEVKRDRLICSPCMARMKRTMGLL
jgi:adenylate kinase